MNNSKSSKQLEQKYFELLNNPKIYNIHFDDLKKMIEEFTQFEFGTYEVKISNKRIDSTILHIKTIRRETDK